MTRVEAQLLALAREVASIASALDPPARRRDRALERIAGALGDDPALASELLAAWQRARRNEALALALAWAREQVRVSLQEILEAGVAAGVVRKEPPPEALSGILLASCEAQVHEVATGSAVVADLVASLARLTEA